MGSTTPSQGLRYPFVDDVITETAQGNLGADIASKLTTQDAARTAVLTRPRVKVARNASQSFADGVDTAVIFDTVSIDALGLVNLGTQPTRITPGSANTGIWKFTLAFFLSGSASRWQLSVAVTGTTQGFRTYATNTSSGSAVVMSGERYVPAGTDYLEFKILHTGGGSISISGIGVNAWQVSS